ncbi:hypothetical protein D1BOALGB6SA_2528 [Olavius sp. associated proteobacterium Delta 1]|nr:hypothetical protein D1BOALGB6SA_2528 [Olavius sp. associated proteobacterium Delta 1]
MWKVDDDDFKKISSWGLESNPFRAIEDFSERKKELRWLNPEHRDHYVRIIHKRLKKMGKTKDEEVFDNYYKKAEVPIDRRRWEYLMARKSWFIMPLGWETIAKYGSSVIDLGCGDGDTIQRLINYVSEYWKMNCHNDRTLKIYGIDINASRIQNAKKLVRSSNAKISFDFRTADVAGEGLEFKDQYFDFAISTGVLEILDDESCDEFIREMCRITKKGIYIEDLLEKFPGGFPRENLNEWLERNGFIVINRYVVFSEPFDVDHLSDPQKLWPIMLDQNIWAERVDKERR